MNSLDTENYVLFALHGARGWKGGGGRFSPPHFSLEKHVKKEFCDLERTTLCVVTILVLFGTWHAV